MQYNRGTLSRHLLYDTGSTGTLIAKEAGLEVYRFKSSPLGGDQEIGAKISEGEIDFLVVYVSRL